MHTHLPVALRALASAVILLAPTSGDGQKWYATRITEDGCDPVFVTKQANTN
jgi:hypothetical protein